MAEIPAGDDNNNTLEVGVRCGHCGGDIYFLTCPIHTEDAWVIASECLSCGFLASVVCPDCEGKIAG